MKKKQAESEIIVDGVTFPQGTPIFHCHLALFKYAPRLLADPFWRPSGTPSQNPYTGQGRPYHARIMAEMLGLKFEWQDFSEKAIRTFSENEQTAICGGGGTSKSASTGLYAFFFWLCSIHDTAVLIASTSIDAAKRRIWKNISEYYSDASRVTGGLDESVPYGSPKPHIRSKPKDTAHGMFVIPVETGDLQKAIDAIKGFHPRRLLIVGDETDAISQAIVDVCANLRIGVEEFQAIWLGNLPSSFNPLGKLMQPAVGQTVTEACGKEWTSVQGIRCLRFDGEDSPNIRDKGKWTGLVRQEDIDAIVRQWGHNSLHYWTMVKGLPAPEGVSNTVLSESTIARFHCYETCTWQRDVVTSVLLDPAFGGDRCALRKITRGIDRDDVLRVQYHPPVVIPINVADQQTPEEYQIAFFVMKFCKENHVPPEEFIGDGTGTGRGVISVLKREWSPNINDCEFGGNPSDLIVSDEDPRPAKEAYDRRITELYFSFVQFVQADIIRGLDPETAKELCEREFQIKGKKMSVQTKTELKSHGRRSPDFADNAVLGPDLLRKKGINAVIRTEVKDRSEDKLDNEVREQDFDGGETYVEDFEVEEGAYGEN